MVEDIEKLRELFLKEAKETPDKYCLSDVERFSEDDQYCSRFVQHHNGNVKNAFKMVKESFKWRKQFKVNEITEKNLNLKSFEARILYPFFQDREDRENLFGMVRAVYYDDLHTVEDIERLVVYWIELLERKSENRGIIITADCTGAGLSNIDMSLVWFFVKLITTYYPCLPHAMIIYDMPSIFVGIWHLIKMTLPKHIADKFKFVDKNSIQEYIDPSNLPISMGGTNTYEYNHVHSEVEANAVETTK